MSYISELEYLSTKKAYEHEVKLACTHANENYTQWLETRKPQGIRSDLAINERCDLVWDFYDKCKIYGVERPKGLVFAEEEHRLQDKCIDCLPLFNGITKQK
jgi:hypothetical protein